ncbi:hypothetical protein F383_12351 [Gossypium arboreum]|nr:hypothetical protein F383_12351 [Gossypium arboreum]
MSLVCN